MSPCPDVGPMMRKKHTGGGCLSPKPHVSVLSHPHSCTRELDLHMLSFAVTFVRCFLESFFKDIHHRSKMPYIHLRNITDDQTQSMKKCSVCKGVFSKQVGFPKRSHRHPEESYNLKCTLPPTLKLPTSSFINFLFSSSLSPWLNHTSLLLKSHPCLSDPLPIPFYPEGR